MFPALTRDCPRVANRSTVEENWGIREWEVGLTLAVFLVALAFPWGKGAGAALRPDCLGGCH